MGTTVLDILLAFWAGIGSFFLPCFLPLLPAYFSFISGVSLAELKTHSRPKRVIVLNTLLFILGFSLVFVILGASATYLGGLLYRYRDWVSMCGGVLIIAFGLFLLGVLKIRFLERERRAHFSSKPAGYLGSIAVGAAFAAGWSPCFGPVIGGILVKASTSGTVKTGILLLISYSAGLALPLLISAIFVDRVLRRFSNLTRYIKTFSIICGVILIVMGLILITGDPLHMFKKF